MQVKGADNEVKGAIAATRVIRVTKEVEEEDAKEEARVTKEANEFAKDGARVEDTREVIKATREDEEVTRRASARKVTVSSPTVKGPVTDVAATTTLGPIAPTERLRLPKAQGGSRRRAALDARTAFTWQPQRGT